MASYRGPSSRSGASTFDRIMALNARRPEEDEFNDTPVSAGRASGVSTDFMEMQDRQEAEKARLAMTPGVVRGGSTATRPQADSPLNVGASTRFTRFGDTYSYDPIAAGEQAGRVEAAGQSALQDQRFSDLRRVPGIDERQATRLVYDQGDVLSQPDPRDTRARVADYTRTPTRGRAADAIAAGANPGLFNDLRPSGDQMPVAPVRGQPEYFDVFEKEEGIRSRYNMQEREHMTRAQLEAERRMDERADAVERRAAQSQVSGRRGEMQRVLSRRPRTGQYVDPLTRQPDEAQFNEAMTNFRADSTETAGALRAAQEHLDLLTGGPARKPTPAASRQPSVLSPAVRPDSLELESDATEIVQGAPGSRQQPTPKLVQWARGDSAKKAYLAERGYDVSRIP